MKKVRILLLLPYSVTLNIECIKRILYAEERPILLSDLNGLQNPLAP